MRPSELNATYDRRFSAHLAYRNQIWSVLAVKYFAGLIAPDAAVLDLGCGYGEFINNIACGRKYGIDLNPRAKQYLQAGVEFLEQDCSQPWPLPGECLDVVFTSNFFEHLPSRESFSNTLIEARRCLRPGGRLVAMGPNIRFVGGAYWNFWDHHLAFTDISMAEALEVHGFEVERVIDRFLPYTTVNRRRAPAALLSMYLKVPLLWKIFGKQFLVLAVKPR